MKLLKMKRILYLIAIVASFTLASCSSDDVAPITPSNISNIASEALPGQIKLTWDVPADKNLDYVQISYYDHLEKKEMLRLASVYSDSIIIPNTRAKYGDYNFTFVPVSSTKTYGTPTQFTAKSGPAPTTTIVDVMPLNLKAEDLFTDAQEPSEGPLANIIDGNVGTFFHGAWSVDFGPLPHYIVVKLPRKVDLFRFSYTTRNAAAAGNHPKEMNIYVSNEFDGTTYDVSGLTPIAELTDLPNGAAQSYTSDNLQLDDRYQYVWFQVRSTHGNTKYFAMSVLNISEVELHITNPEAPSEDD